MNQKDIIKPGQVFHRWTIVALSPNKQGAQILWYCRCQCGTMREVTGCSLLNGTSKSCGCLRREILCKPCNAVRSQKNPLYSIYRSMMTRCYNRNHPSFVNYGGRGIEVCEQWRNDFDAFAEDMGGERPEGMTLDRIDYNGDYEPSNCRWANVLTQQRNRRTSIKCEWKGRKLTITEIARDAGWSYHNILRFYKITGCIHEAVHRSSLAGVKYKERAKCLSPSSLSD